MALEVGIKHLRDGIEPQFTSGAIMDVLGVIGPAEGADADMFPLNKVVYLKSNERLKVAALGSQGTLAQAIRGMSAQLSGSARAAKVVVVRTAEGANVHETIANIVGSEANGTGIWAFLDAPEDLGVTPRLIIAPGYTSQTVRGLINPEITAAGTGGTNGTFALAFTGGTGTGGAGTFTVTAGALTNVTITSPGSYTVKPTLAFTASTGLTGASASVDLEQVSNGICAAIPAVTGRLKAKFLPEGPTNSRQDWLDWLETLPASADILHPLRQDAKVYDEDGELITVPLSPYIMALYARRDSERDGVPSGSICNQPVYGLVGVSPKIYLSLTDETSQGQEDLAAGAGIVAKGEAGVEDAPGSSGFSFWGYDTMSDQTEWRFAHVNRMRDYIELGQIKANRMYLGRFNITLQTVEAIMNTIRMDLARLAADQHILSPFKVDFEPQYNSAGELRDGEIDISFAVEEPPVLRKLILRSRRHLPALDALVQTISVQLGAAA